MATNVNQIHKIQIISLFVIFVLMGCKKDSSKEIIKDTSISKKTKTIPLRISPEEVIVRRLEYNKFALSIKTQFSNDTLDIIDYKNDFCSSPIILTQELSFFEKNKLIKHYKLPIQVLKKKTITKNNLKTLKTPIYEIFLTKGNSYYYIVNGADCCNGVDCAEFTGIYTMLGEVIYEGTSMTKEKVSLADILHKYKINLNKSEKSIRTDK